MLSILFSPEVQEGLETNPTATIEPCVLIGVIVEIDRTKPDEDYFIAVVERQIEFTVRDEVDEMKAIQKIEELVLKN